MVSLSLWAWLSLILCVPLVPDLDLAATTASGATFIESTDLSGSADISVMT